MYHYIRRVPSMLSFCLAEFRLASGISYPLSQMLSQILLPTELTEVFVSFGSKRSILYSRSPNLFASATSLRPPGTGSGLIT